MTAAARLAAFIAAARFTDLPEAAIRFGRSAFLDTVGVVLAGVRTPVGQMVIDHVRSLDAAPRATVLGAGFRTVPAEAAFVNGTLGHALDLDDWGPSMWGHPSVPVVPAVLAVAEAEGRSGRDALLAYVLGVEVEGKLGSAGIQAHIARGWHSTGTLGTLAAAAAAGKLLGLSAEQLQHALGLAASMASGLFANVGSLTKPVHVGQAAKNGVTAAYLARRGVTARPAAIEGFCETFFGPDHRLAAAIETLGRPWDIVSPGVGLKRYPCCSDIHPSLDAILALREQHGLRGEDVAAVDAAVTVRVTSPIDRPEPKDATDAMFSYQYCLAAALIDGALGPAQLTPARFADPAIHDLRRRVHLRLAMEPQAKLGPFDVPAHISVRLWNGTVLTTTAKAARGCNENPFTRDELFAKYQSCAAGVLSPADVESTFADLERLEHLPSLDGILARLRNGSFERLNA